MPHMLWRRSRILVSKRLCQQFGSLATLRCNQTNQAPFIKCLSQGCHRIDASDRRFNIATLSKEFAHLCIRTCICPLAPYLFPGFQGVHVIMRLDAARGNHYLHLISTLLQLMVFVIPTLQALSNVGILDTNVGQGPHVGQHCTDVWYPMLDKNMGVTFSAKTTKQP